MSTALHFVLMKDQRARDASVVMPVHNEELMLPITLPTVFNLKPREIILVEDRCEDRTDEIAGDIGNRYPDVKLVRIRVSQNSDWTHHLNFLYDLGIRNASSEIVLLTQADLLLDSRQILKNIHFAENGIVNFTETYRGNLWSTLVIRFLSMLPIRKFPGSVIAMNRSIYLRDNFRSKDLRWFDALIFRRFVIQKNAPCFVINSRNVNLRPYPKARLYEMGMDNYKDGKAMWKVLLFAMTRGQPLVFAGYIHARNESPRQMH